MTGQDYLNQFEQEQAANKSKGKGIGKFLGTVGGAAAGIGTAIATGGATTSMIPTFIQGGGALGGGTGNLIGGMFASGGPAYIKSKSNSYGMYIPKASGLHKTNSYGGVAIAGEKHLAEGGEYIVDSEDGNKYVLPDSVNGTYSMPYAYGKKGKYISYADAYSKAIDKLDPLKREDKISKSAINRVKNKLVKQHQDHSDLLDTLENTYAAFGGSFMTPMAPVSPANSMYNEENMDPNSGLMQNKSKFKDLNFSLNLDFNRSKYKSKPLPNQNNFNNQQQQMNYAVGGPFGQGLNLPNLGSGFSTPLEPSKSNTSYLGALQKPLSMLQAEDITSNENMFTNPEDIGESKLNTFYEYGLKNPVMMTSPINNILNPVQQTSNTQTNSPQNTNIPTSVNPYNPQDYINQLSNTNTNPSEWNKIAENYFSKLKKAPGQEEDNSDDLVKLAKKMAKKQAKANALKAGIGAGAQSLGALSALGYGLRGGDDVSFGREAETRVNPKAAMNAGINALNKITAGSKAAVRGNAKTYADLLAGNVVADNALMDSIGQTVINPTLAMQQFNAQLDKSRKVNNTNIAMQEAIARQQEQDAARSAVTTGLGGVGSAAATGISDFNKYSAQSNYNNQMMSLLPDLFKNYDISQDENGNWKINPKSKARGGKIYIKKK